MLQTMRPVVTTGRRCGALGTADGGVTWRVWAPRAERVELVLWDEHGGTRTEALEAEEGGYFAAWHADVADGQRYAYRLDGGEARQDPSSLWQPDGVPGASAVYRPERFGWTDAGWKGVGRADLVIYELHVGTFTKEGTFEAIIPRLGELRELGVTAIELMPVAQFPGDRNWGYDGVLPYAAQNTYGGPAGLQRLVDAAHREGVAVLLDVVYNHMGPEGNFLHEFGPYVTDRYKTPWGTAMNYDDKGSGAVRDWVLDNARMWLEEFHLDGLRLDAVHAIYDMGARHILRAIHDVGEAVRRGQGREIHVVAESDLNDPKVVLPVERGGHGMDGQWSDDFHHSVHALLTGERRGYYVDYGKPEQLARALETPFVYAWDYSPSRGRKHGAPVPPGVSGDLFVVSIQNHDQVGNRAKGDRLGVMLGSAAKQRLAASLLLLSAHVPMLFMGEEYGEERPFPFFCSFAGEELVEAVRRGRRREFADFVRSVDEVPDPDARETFESAVLTWAWPEGTVHAGIRRLYGDLLAARKKWKGMGDFGNRSARVVDDGAVIRFERGVGEERLVAFFNLEGRRRAVPGGVPEGWRAAFASELSAYGGERKSLEGVTELMGFECVVFVKG